MRLLLQSSTAQPLLFLLVLASDHVTPATGLSPAVTLSKSGGAFASPSGAVTEIANGWYKVAGNATDTGTLGPLVLHASVATADPADVYFDVVSFNPQDSVRLGLTAIPNAAAGASGGLPLAVDASGRVDVLKINGTSQTARDIGASVLLSPGTGTGQLTITGGVASVNATQLAGQTITAAAGVTFPTSVASPTNITAGTIASVSGSVGSVTGAVGSVTGSVGSVTGSVGSVTGAVGSVTGNVGGNVVGSVGSISGITFPSHFPLLAIDGSGLVTFNNSGIATASALSTDTSSILTAISAESAPSATTISAAVVDQLLSGHTNVGSVGAALNAAGAASDPLATVLPGPYTDLQAGALIYQLHVTPTNQPLIAVPATTVSGMTQAFLYCRDGAGNLRQGIRVEFQLLSPPGSDSFATTIFDVLSDSFGLLQVNLVQNSTFQARRGSNGAWVSFTTGSSSTLALPQILGTP